MDNQKKFDIYDRVFKFAVRVAKMLKQLQKDTAILEYSRQLIRSSGFIGANLAEADGALSKKDFINKMGIARREAQESHHWLRLISSVVSFDHDFHLGEIDPLVAESKEIMLILSSIVKKAKENH